VIGGAIVLKTRKRRLHGNTPRLKVIIDNFESADQNGAP